MAIKISQGKLLKDDKPFESVIASGLSIARATLLPIEPKHIHQLVSLPLHHRDPFDCMLVAQSLVEGAPIISSDEAFDAYGVDRIW